MCWLTDLFKSKATIERPSPKIRIKPEPVHIAGGTLTVTGLSGCFIAAIAPTNSLDPCIDDGMLVVLDPNVNVTDLICGDIIWYETPNYQAIHRIIEIGNDESGWWALCRGDNNPRDDGIKVRSHEIRGVWRATLD